MDAPGEHRSNRRKGAGMRQPRARSTSRASIASLALFGALAGSLIFTTALTLAALAFTAARPLRNLRRK
jgi:hypothetical protein